MFSARRTPTGTTAATPWYRSSASRNFLGLGTFLTETYGVRLRLFSARWRRAERPRPRPRREKARHETARRTTTVIHAPLRLPDAWRSLTRSRWRPLTSGCWALCAASTSSRLSSCFCAGFVSLTSTTHSRRWPRRWKAPSKASLSWRFLFRMFREQFPTLTKKRGSSVWLFMKRRCFVFPCSPRFARLARRTFVCPARSRARSRNRRGERHLCRTFTRPWSAQRSLCATREAEVRVLFVTRPLFPIARLV
mmetsp:Transcript_13877/g.45922  ORF Transcript_13877/g.45922 Transcript_13877/m.45922 type:complete len:251 (+) Transcript_13877:3209-3961(+)